MPYQDWKPFQSQDDAKEVTWYTTPTEQLLTTT